MKTTQHLFFIFLFIPFLNFSQLQEGFLQFHIDVTAVDTSLNARQTASMMKNSKMEIYFAKDLSRVDFEMGKITHSSIRINRKLDKGITITKSIYGNYANQGSVDEISGSQPETSTTDFEITPFNEYKNILGFKCRKYVMEENGSYATYWLTDEIILEDMGQHIINPNLPGFPLEFVSISNGIRMSFKASNFKNELDNKTEIFSTEPPEGYTQMKR
ncbi:hypothetical protein [Brumimicrobium oceani]|uniref:DUF4412 domain-containing protein n=1 Tax=Brumimicrobium oceani TaxID=2100725 RepID=A0A2U2XFQ4_9FLAO|nr:hypothetical protein [Brumimicrobium oceani]PWH86628.1 hypothetical protein DIT68_05185 [Brumimicrobium oceani]